MQRERFAGETVIRARSCAEEAVGLLVAPAAAVLADGDVSRRGAACSRSLPTSPPPQIALDRLPSINQPLYRPQENRGEQILSMAATTETQQLRMLERLRSAGAQPVTLDQLRAGGIDFPAVVVGELELNGYAIERVYEHGRQIGLRLLDSDVPDPPAPRRRHRWRRVSR